MGRNLPRLQPGPDRAPGALEDGKHPEFFLAGSQLYINSHHMSAGIEWPHGVVGYHVRFTCGRSPVRTWMALFCVFLSRAQHDMEGKRKDARATTALGIP